jgi:hypothetical protein
MLLSNMHVVAAYTGESFFASSYAVAVPWCRTAGVVHKSYIQF